MTHVTRHDPDDENPVLSAAGPGNGGRLAGMEPRLRRGLLAIAISLTGLLFAVNAYYCAKNPHVRKTRTTWGSDHVSHVSTVPFFLRHGFAIYAETARDLCGPQSEEARARDGDACEEELTINWQQYPRVYPPLNLLYHLPEGLAKMLGASDAATNLATMLQYLAVAALGLVLLAWALLRETALHPLLAFAAWAILANQVWIHTSNGFYDGVAILFVGLAVRELFRCGGGTGSAPSSPERGLFFYTLGLGLHYRALWFLPIGILFGVRALRRFPRQTTRERTLFFVSIGIVAVTALCLFLASPMLADFPVSNAFYWKNGWPPEWKPIAGVLTVLYLGFAAFRLPIFLSVSTLWLFGFLTIVREFMPWHSLFLVPWMLALAYASPAKRVANLLVPIGFVLLWFLLQRPFLYELFPTEMVDAVIRG